MAAAKEVEHRGFYLDLLSLYDFIKKKDYQYPSTPALSLMFALDYQLDRILAEGLEERFARHQAIARRVREWAKNHFALFPDEKYCSNTLTVIANTRQINVSGLINGLKERGFVISNGYGDLKEKTFRIAHMGDMTLAEVEELLANIEELL